MVQIQIELLVSRGDEAQKSRFGEAILNAMRISSSYWNVQVTSTFLPYFHKYCTSSKQKFEGNIILSEAKYDTEKLLHSGSWYYGDNSSHWNPYQVPSFMDKPSKEFDFSDC